MPDPDFDFPDIQPSRGKSFGAFISAKRGSNSLGVSKELTQRLDLSDGDRVILAIDGERTPWIGFLGEDELHEPDQVGPSVTLNQDTTNSIASRPIVTQLRPHLPDKERRRFYLTGQNETVAVQGTQVTLHELTVRGDIDD